jgi:hypothetical protein
VVTFEGGELDSLTVIRISRQPSPVTVMIDQKQLENVECFKYFGSVLTNDGRCIVKLNPRLPWQKLHSTRRRLFTSTLDLNLREKAN